VPCHGLARSEEEGEVIVAIAGRVQWKRGALLACLAGIVMLVAGASLFVELLSRADRRAETGAAVLAQVVQTGSWGFGHFGGRGMTVVYMVDGVPYQATLASLWGSRDVAAVGSAITVHVDPADARKVVAGDGYISEYRYTLVPPLTFAVGVVVLAIGASNLGRGSGGGRRRRLVARDAYGSDMPILVEFDLTPRGYDVAAVNDMIIQAVPVLDSRDLAVRAAMARTLSTICLPVGCHGYDQRQVDRFIDQALRELSP
jgi:hypothetical protein